MKKSCLCLLVIAIVVVMLLAVPASAAGGGFSADASFGDLPSQNYPAPGTGGFPADAPFGNFPSQGFPAPGMGGFPADVPFGDSDSADLFGNLNPGAGEMFNVLSSAILFPLCIISISLWFFRAYGVAVEKDTEKSNNVWLKIYKVLRRVHIPAGAATLLIGLYHTIFASIKHGWSLNWGTAAMFFYLLGFVTWLLRKKLSRRWLVLHQTTTLIATICMLVHSAPYLKLVFTMIAPMMLMKTFGG